MITLTACDTCQSLFLSTAWCHDRMTSTVGRVALAPDDPVPDPGEEMEARFETAADGGEL